MPADGVNNIASILHETLAKLKRPNKHFLKPLQLPANSLKNSNIFESEQPVEQETAQPKVKDDFKNYRKRKLIKQAKQKEVSPVNIQAPEDKLEEEETDEMVDEVELDLDELTQEDKFYLI